MKQKRLLTFLLLLVAGVGNVLHAQTSVTAGAQVTSESSLVSGKAYLIQQKTGNDAYTNLTDDGQYLYSNNSSANLASVFYFISSGDKWKLLNAFTGRYWGVPSKNDDSSFVNSRLTTVPTESEAGNWSLNFDNSLARPTAFASDGTTLKGIDRASNYLLGWSDGTKTGNTTYIRIYEVSAPALSTTALNTLAGYDVSVSATAATSLSEGLWYVVKNQTTTPVSEDGGRGYIFENQGVSTFYNTATAPSGSATDNAKYLVRLLSAGNGKYYLQTGYGNYMGAIEDGERNNSATVPVTSLGTAKLIIDKINSTNGHFYLQNADNNAVLDAISLSDGDAKLVGWGTTVPTATGGNNDWAFYPVELVSSWVPTIAEVYTINNTNSGRGALIYDSSNPDYVWSSGKSGTFNATQANSQWVIVPTGTEDQYYLYNVGAGKFAVPTGAAQGAQNPWKFSNSAVAVKFIIQSDGTYKIQMAKDPVSGTNAAYLAVSNGQTYPIINYNDVGGNFTITKVEGNQSTAATAAVNKLVKSQTALTAVPSDDGWYIMRTKTSGTASHVGRYVFAPEEGVNYGSTNYPLSFTGDVAVEPAINDVTYYVRFSKSASSFNWQVPSGRYMAVSGTTFPRSSVDAGAITLEYSNGITIKSGSYWAIPYNSNAAYILGGSSSTSRTYDIYPINLTSAGLTAWHILCDAAPETATIACTRSDVSGLTSVYKNGYIFLPTGVTPESSDFTLDGATSVTVDASAKTVTFEYNPNLAIVADGVSVAQGWQTAGRNSEVMLLRVNAAPFAKATGATLNVSLLDGAKSQISALTLYEASSDSPEILSAGNSGAPTKTQVATTAIDGSSATATLAIGDLSAGNHYYWLAATVKTKATLGAVIDAAVEGITYTRNEVQTTLDLTATGKPADRGAMVFNTHSYPFLPWDNGSHVYRIPAMVVANDGSIIAAVDKRYDSHTDIGNGHVIDIVVRRSTNGGKTWGDQVVVAKGQGIVNEDGSKCGYGDPTLMKLTDGTLLCTSCVGNLGFGGGLTRFMVSKSTDNGQTWSDPVDVTTVEGMLTIKPNIGDFFITSGKGILTTDGILMYLVVAKYNGANTNFVIYSTDKGEHWTIDDTVVYNYGDEAKLEQLNDGSLIASIRQGNGRGFNFGTYTKNDDGTVSFSWGTQYQNSQLHNGGNPNNQDILYYQRESETGKTDVIFHSMTTGTHANLKLYCSTDQGKNWTEFLNVQTKGTRYVTMAKSSKGSLYLLFEDQSLNAAGNNSSTNHYPINFLEITREQLVARIPALDTSVSKTVTLKAVGGKSYATLCLPYDATTSEATKAYYVTTANNGYAQLTATGGEGTEIPANTAVVLVNSKAATTTSLTTASGLTSVVTPDKNLLKGTLVSRSLDLAAGNGNFALGVLNGNIGFYKFNDNGTTTITLGANKAYLEVPASGDAAVKGFALSFDGENGIQAIGDGQRARDDAGIFNLAGQRVSKPTRGLYIQRGQKVIIK